MCLFFCHLPRLHQVDLGARDDPDLAEVLAEARKLSVLVVQDRADPQHEGSRFGQHLPLEGHSDDKNLLVSALVGNLLEDFLPHEQNGHELRVSLRHIDDPFHAGPIAERHDGDQKIRRRLRSHA